MFDKIVKQIQEAADKNTALAEKIRLERILTIPNAVKQHFKYTYRTRELRACVMALRRSATRGQIVVVVRDIATNLCAAFQSVAEAAKCLGICKSSSVVWRINAPYDVDVAWQWLGIRKEDRLFFRNLFRTPLLPVPAEYTTRNNNFHITLRKGDSKMMVVGLVAAERITGLNRQALYNLLLKEGSPAEYTEYTARISTVTDFEYFPDYLPKEIDHIVYAHKNVEDACCGRGPIAFGKRYEKTEPLALARALRVLAPQKTRIYKPRACATV